MEQEVWQCMTGSVAAGAAGSALYRKSAWQRGGSTLSSKHPSLLLLLAPLIHTPVPATDATMLPPIEPPPAPPPALGTGNRLGSGGVAPQ